MLQTISMTLSDIQVQLSSIQDQNSERDATLKQLQQDMKEMKGLKRSADDDGIQKSKKGKKSPCGLSACVRKVHASFNDEDQYHADQGIKSSHNQCVTEKIVKNVVDSGDYTQKDDISYAAKKYHEYLVRQLKIGEEEKQRVTRSNRIIQRRQRLFERRKKSAIRKEIPILQALSEKFMSDEETDTEDNRSLIKRTLKWRSQKLNELLNKLDERYLKSREKKDSVRPMKVRKTGSPSDRSPPRNAPDWAVVDSSPTDPELSGSALDEEPPLSDDSPLASECEEDPEMDSWISQVTGVHV